MKHVDDVVTLMLVLGQVLLVEPKNMVTPHRPILRPGLALWAIQLLVPRWDGNYWDCCEVDVELNCHVIEMC